MFQRILAGLMLVAILVAVAFKFESADSDTKTYLFYFVFLLNCLQHLYYSNKTDKLEKKLKGSSKNDVSPENH